MNKIKRVLISVWDKTGIIELAEFLISNPGLNSGFMMLQVTAAALASENKSNVKKYENWKF